MAFDFRSFFRFTIRLLSKIGDRAHTCRSRHAYSLEKEPEP